jgi:hypothetical protein
VATVTEHEVLLRRGTLALVRWRAGAGLYREQPDGSFRPAGALGPEEWRWTLTCAAPVAVFAGAGPPPEPGTAGPLTNGAT